jgi:hypothetical protein
MNQPFYWRSEWPVYQTIHPDVKLNFKAKWVEYAANVCFRLGMLYRNSGIEQLAVKYFGMAERLNRFLLKLITG